MDSADLFKPSCPKKSNALVLDFGHDILTIVDRFPHYTFIDHYIYMRMH